MKNLWIIVVLTGINIATTLAQDKKALLALEIDSLYKKSDLPGFAVALVNADSIIFKKSYGYENVATNKPFLAEQRFNIASISKTFIGLGLLSLVEKGELNLNTPINQLLPFTVINPHNKAAITIAHLATHTSSILDNDIEEKSWYLDEPLNLSKKEVGKDNYKMFCNWSENTKESLGDFLKASLTKDGDHFSKKRFSKKKPGTSYSYSNIGAALAAYIIELTTGIAYDQYIEKLVIDKFGFPAGLWKHTEPKLPTSYFQNKIAVPAFYPILYPTGGMMLSINELHSYLIAMIKGYKGKSDLLNAESFQQMLNPIDGKGVFWELKENTIGHNGGNYGVICLMSFDKDSGFGRIILTNISSYKSDNILKQVVEIWNTLGDFEL